MILKEKQVTEQTDRRLIAGDAAEKQMAFHLKRAFGSSEDVWVINDLRIEHGGEAAQMDHLLVSQRGYSLLNPKALPGAHTSMLMESGRVNTETAGKVWLRRYFRRMRRGICSNRFC